MVTPTAVRQAVLWLSLLTASAAAASDFEDLVAAERAFAADASARSVREAFLAALAADGMVFAPGPVNGQATWQARPENKARLEWAPEWAEVSADGALGYTSGPWRFTPEGGDKPAAFGHYLSVWQKQADGQWKLLIDHGVSHAEQAFPPQVVRRGAISAGAAPLWPVGMGELRKADLAPPGQVFDSMVSADFLRLRPGRLPDARAESAAFELPAAVRQDIGALISQAGDLAVTWGGGVGSPSWLRVWRRPAASDPPGLGWRLAVDMSLPAPKPATEH